MTVSDTPLFFQLWQKVKEGMNFAVLALYYSITLSGEFFFPNHHRIVLKECVSGNQSCMSSGGHRLLVTISFQLTNNNNNNRYGVNDDKQGGVSHYGLCSIVLRWYNLFSFYTSHNLHKVLYEVYLLFEREGWGGNEMIVSTKLIS